MTHETTTPRRSTKLYKDPIDKKIGGVAAGVAKYFDVDTTLVRAIWAVSILVGGFGLLLYLVLWFILDDDPEAIAAPIEPRPVQAAPVDEPPAEVDTALKTADEEIQTETPEADLEEASPEA
ncbi:MAG: PspC domain-containing protein [Acidimicrobiia bacterium]|nr:PspC domain-containing protein [Acidimicrobiia bacterium]